MFAIYQVWQTTQLRMRALWDVALVHHAQTSAKKIVQYTY
jgi:hypothetical protein